MSDEIRKCPKCGEKMIYYPGRRSFGKTGKYICNCKDSGKKSECSKCNLEKGCPYSYEKTKDRDYFSGCHDFEPEDSGGDDKCAINCNGANEECEPCPINEKPPASREKECQKKVKITDEFQFENEEGRIILYNDGSLWLQRKDSPTKTFWYYLKGSGGEKEISRMSDLGLNPRKNQEGRDRAVDSKPPEPKFCPSCNKQMWLEMISLTKGTWKCECGMGEIFEKEEPSENETMFPMSEVSLRAFKEETERILISEFVKEYQKITEAIEMISEEIESIAVGEWDVKEDLVGLVNQLAGYLNINKEKWEARKRWLKKE